MTNITESKITEVHITLSPMNYSHTWTHKKYNQATRSYYQSTGKTAKRTILKNNMEMQSAKFNCGKLWDKQPSLFNKKK